MSKFSNIGERINRHTNSLTIENQSLTSDDLNELFNNEDVKKISTLSLINCNISEIPETIINLEPRLRGLYLNYNNITTIPNNFKKMNFFILNLTGNPITVNKHNIDILYEIYSVKIGERSRPQIIFYNKELNGNKIPVIGNLNLRTGDDNKKSNKRMYSHRLMEQPGKYNDFTQLREQISSSS